MALDCMCFDTLINIKFWLNTWDLQYNIECFDVFWHINFTNSNESIHTWNGQGLDLKAICHPLTQDEVQSQIPNNICKYDIFNKTCIWIEMLFYYFGLRNESMISNK